MAFGEVQMLTKARAERSKKFSSGKKFRKKVARATAGFDCPIRATVLSLNLNSVINPK